MPISQVVKPECQSCEKKESEMWRQLPEGIVCSVCYEKRREEEKNEIEQKLKEEEVKPEPVDLPKTLKVPLRKSTRMSRNYKTRSNPYALPKPTIGRGRGRRGLPKRVAFRSHTEGKSLFKSNRAYLVDGFLRVGDVVSLCGSDDKLYYAQLRGFVYDPYGEKMGVITWLLPTAERVKGKFVPEHFYLGPDEDTPRRLDTMELEYRVPAGCTKYRFYNLTKDLTDGFTRELIHS